MSRILVCLLAPIVLVSALMSLSACSDEAADRSVAASSDWVDLVDEASGLEFQLPEDVAPQSGDQGALSVRVYSVQDGQTMVSVTVLDTGSPLGPEYLSLIYQKMKSGLASQGASDVTLDEEPRTSLDLGDANDATLSFTATDGARNYWRLRAIDTGTQVIQAQVITFSDTDHEAARAEVDAAFEQLTGSLSMP